jgi:hypothetical protein
VRAEILYATRTRGFSRDMLETRGCDFHTLRRSASILTGADVPEKLDVLQSTLFNAYRL